MEARERVPEMLPEDMRYFDRVAFTAWLVLHLGHLGERRQADILNITRRFLRQCKSGDAQPGLETYMRMIAAVQAPLGTWLRTSQVSGRDSIPE